MVNSIELSLAGISQLLRMLLSLALTHACITPNHEFEATRNQIKDRLQMGWGANDNGMSAEVLNLRHRFAPQQQTLFQAAGSVCNTRT